MFNKKKYPLLDIKCLTICRFCLSSSTNNVLKSQGIFYKGKKNLSMLVKENCCVLRITLDWKWQGMITKSSFGTNQALKMTMCIHAINCKKKMCEVKILYSVYSHYGKITSDDGFRI